MSVLIPSFNRESFIGECISSALAQTFTDLEVVVVDGASTDGTWAVIEQYAASDPRVRAYRDARNTGPVGGWWHCLEEAQGELATFLWSDDLHKPQFLQSTIEALTDEVGFVFTAAEIGAEPGQGEVNYSHPSRTFPSGEFIASSLLGGSEYPVSPACALFRTDDLRKSFTSALPSSPPVDLTSTGAGTDLLFYLHTARRYPSIANLAEPLAFFRSHPGSLTVEGRGGEVVRNYALSKACFARSIDSPTVARSILAAHWIGEMVETRSLISPWRASRRYCGIVGPVGLLVGGVSAVARRLVANLSRSAHAD